MNSENNNSNSGIGFSGLLFLVFLVLKLLNKIDWSWLWVTSPLWIPLCIFIAILFIVGIASFFKR